jgi:hypothetical protein
LGQCLASKGYEEEFFVLGYEPCSPVKVNQSFEEHITSNFRNEWYAKEEISMQQAAQGFVGCAS